MPAPRTGVNTIPGHLTHYLDELDLSRKELAEALGITVRTIHNIEYGRKRVNREVLEQLAAALNGIGSQNLRNRSLALTADHFISHPTASLSVLFQTIAMNDVEPLFIGERPIAALDLRWTAPGNRRAIPFAGAYAGSELVHLYGRLHQAVEFVSFKNVRVHSNDMSSQLAVQFIAAFRHSESKQVIDIGAMFQISMNETHIQSVDSNYEMDRLAEFLQSGVPPRDRKSDPSA